MALAHLRSTKIMVVMKKDMMTLLMLMMVIFPLSLLPTLSPLTPSLVLLLLLTRRRIGQKALGVRYSSPHVPAMGFLQGQGYT